MKIKLLAAFAALSLCMASHRALAAEQSDAGTELKDLVTKISAKIKEGAKSEQALAPELKEFEALVAKHKGEKSEDAAQILNMEAMLYLQILDNTDKGTELLNQLKRDFPDTKAGQSVDKVLESIKAQEGAKKIQRSLTVGSQFPDFSEKDLAGKPLSIANYKGKVVLIDFWATWCMPCVRELPNVIKAFEAYHKKGFEIIGISLDKDKDKLTAFTKEKDMTWPQYFDGLGWQNKLAVKYGVNSIPATYLLGGDGKIIGKDLGGEALEKALSEALARK
ncbi:MAG: TlpA disulfide reductase family protein [Verrucomicrobiota bacterium]